MKAIKIVLSSAVVFALALFLAQNPVRASSQQCTVSNPSQITTLTITMTKDNYIVPEQPAANIVINSQQEIWLDYYSQLFKDNQLVVDKSYSQVHMNEGSNVFTLADALGGWDKIPTQPGNYKLIVTQGGIYPTGPCEVDFIISIGPSTVTLSSLDISPAVYVLGDTVTGAATVINSASSSATTSFSIELYKGSSTLFWHREIDNAPIPPGTNTYTLSQVFGFKPTIPMDLQFLGGWNLKIKNLQGAQGSVSKSFTIGCPQP